MPFARPTLTQLTQQAATDLTAALPGTDPLLRFSNLNITVKVQAGFANGHYGYLDWISLQATPFSATDPAYVIGWAALKSVTLRAALLASGAVTFTGTSGTVPINTPLVRGDGAAYVTTASGVIAGGTVTVPVQAAVAGSAANAIVGTTISLASPIAGITAAGAVSTALAGGTDTETITSLKARMLSRYAAPPQGGARGDYPAWALALPAVTRAWCIPNGFGLGTVVVYAMLDVANAAFGGFPQGADGVAGGEPRGALGTGDQLAIANAIFPLQPALALVYVCSPIAAPQAFTIHAMPAALQSLVGPAIDAALVQYGSPGGVYLASGATGGAVALAQIWAAIAAATGCYTFQITSPSSDLTSAVGHIPTRGAITFS